MISFPSSTWCMVNLLPFWRAARFLAMISSDRFRIVVTRCFMRCTRLLGIALTRMALIPGGSLHPTIQIGIATMRKNKRALRAALKTETDNIRHKE